MKKLSLTEIVEVNKEIREDGEVIRRSGEGIIKGLRNREFSILQSLGLHKMKAEMNFTGFICHLVVFLSGVTIRKRFDRHWQKYARKHIAGVLRLFAPVKITGTFPNPNYGMAIGFNHPSLGEILRFIHVSISTYGHQKNLYPVNLPWYEALMPIADVLEACGIYIMPIITPSTTKKMEKALDGESMKVVAKLSSSFHARYFDACAECAKDGHKIWVAPSATRQRTVFQSLACARADEQIHPQTMSLMVDMITHKVKNLERFDVLPVAVKPPKHFGRFLNLFRKYEFRIGEMMSLDEIKRLRKNPKQIKVKEANGKERTIDVNMFEWTFLHNIATALREMGGRDLIIPDEEVN